MNSNQLRLCARLSRACCMTPVPSIRLCGEATPPAREGRADSTLRTVTWSCSRQPNTMRGTWDVRCTDFHRPRSFLCETRGILAWATFLLASTRR